MIQRQDIEKAIACMPVMLRDKREALRSSNNPGEGYGIRKAARQAGISPSSFHRAEHGEVKDLGVLCKLLDFLGQPSVEKAWTDAEEFDLTMMFAMGETDVVIAGKLGKSIRAVQQKRHRMRLLRRKRRPRND